jgi:nitrogen fixation/metabolism regulation signal transduction histidine kinase
LQDEKPVFQVRIGISERLEKETIKQIMFSLFYITLAVLAAALGISVLLARKLTRPLTMLSAAAADIADKNLYRPIPNDSKMRLDNFRLSLTGC